ncbi:hypothetical protein TNIN_410671 [Trichonephila inaurata madagascariensis]|uniref:Uncharacterized protein n=1 Tax=Trichonephila inaurata madagascariensis TaxID=2747483 RepID=A0A8X6YKG0_9ARAC|nr:hypothetical protein TNIN_410671 [Trichonephila inaurata madagascariensis]
MSEREGKREERERTRAFFLSSPPPLSIGTSSVVLRDTGAHTALNLLRERKVPYARSAALLSFSRSVDRLPIYDVPGTLSDVTGYTSTLPIGERPPPPF